MLHHTDYIAKYIKCSPGKTVCVYIYINSKVYIVVYEGQVEIILSTDCESSSLHNVAKKIATYFAQLIYQISGSD